MILLDLKTEIDAPINRVFDLARSIDLHIDSAAGTSEKATIGVVSGLIGLDENVTWEAIHFGIKLKMSVKIIEYDRPLFFIDEMIDGLFSSFKHRHKFIGHGLKTDMIDTLSFESPYGLFGSLVDTIFLKNYFLKFLKKRNLCLKHIAEGCDYNKYLDKDKVYIP